MSEFNRSNVYAGTGDSLRTYMTKVFMKMAAGLGVTALTSFACYLSLISGGIVYQILSGGMVFSLILLFVQLGLCVALTAGITRFSTGTATLLFYAYAALTGLTFSTFPVYFGVNTMFTAFLFCAVLFVCCAIIAHNTNIDMTQFRGILCAGLITLLIVTIASLFIPVLRESLAISYLGVILFLFYTVYDVQKIKAFYYAAAGDERMSGNLAVYGAFELYLDFINLFIRIISILGRRNSRD